jgi:hypothetical protein
MRLRKSLLLSKFVLIIVLLCFNLPIFGYKTKPELDITYDKSSEAVYQKTLHKGWNWISFPVLQRDSINNSSVELSKIMELFNGKATEMINPNYERVFYSACNWILPPSFSGVISTEGYKINTTDSINIRIRGSLLNPNTIIKLNKNKDNWIGYFLPKSIKIEDAFETEIMDKFEMIKTENWSMHRMGDIWLKSSENQILNFGDMLVIRLKKGITDDVSFKWKNKNAVNPDESKTADHYKYNKYADYIPIFAKINTKESPTEIGVFVDGKCCGASVYQGKNSIIKMYLKKEDLNKEMTFEFYYEKTAVCKEVFRVKQFNIQTKVFEYIPIIANRNIEYYYLEMEE